MQRRKAPLMFIMDLGPGASAQLVVVSLRGELDLIDAADVATALKALAARERWIIVDLAGLQFIDAVGVSALMRARRLACDAGGGLLLAAPHGIVQQVLRLIWGADDCIIEASVAAAVASAEIFRARSHAGPAAALRPPVEGVGKVVALSRRFAPGAPERETT